MSETTHCLYRLLPARPAMVSDGPTDHEAEVAGRHDDYLQSLNQRGVVFMAGRTLDPDQGVFGIVILERPWPPMPAPSWRTTRLCNPG